MSVSVNKQAELTGHKWNVFCLKFSPSGLHLASGSWDKSAIVWDLRTLEPSLILRHHSQPITTVSWQKHGDDTELFGLLATGSSDNTVALWNSENGSLLNILSHHSSWVLGTDFNADGSLVASVSWDKLVIVSNARTGKVVNALQGHTTGVWTCAFNPEGNGNGDILCSGAEDGSLKLWDLRSNSVVMSLVGGHDDRVKSCAWSPHGQYLASCAADGKVTVWEPRLGTALTKIRGHEDIASHVEFYPFLSSKSVPVLFSSGGRYCRTWHPFRKRKQLEAFKPFKQGEEVEAFSLSPDGTLLAIGGSHEDIALYSVEVSLDELDALPADSPEKNVNHGTQLWKKYTRKIIEQKIESERTISLPSESDAQAQNSAVLVERAVQHNKQKEEERATSPPPEKLTAEPEVMLQEHRRRLRPGSFIEADLAAWTAANVPDLNNSPGVPQLQEARQHLRKVRRSSNGSSTSSGSDVHGFVTYDAPNGWTNNYPHRHSNGFHSETEDGVVVSVINYSNGDGYFSPANGRPISPPSRGTYERGPITVNPRNRYGQASVTESRRNRAGSDAMNDDASTVITIDGESTSSAASSNYYGDIDDVGQEMLDLTRRVQVYKF